MRIVDSRLPSDCANRVHGNRHSSWFTVILDVTGLHEYCRIPVYDSGLLQSSEISVYFAKFKEWNVISKPVTRATVNPEVTCSRPQQPCTIPVNSFLFGNKCQLDATEFFFCRSYCLLNMFRAQLCPSSGAQEYYTVVAACGISCCPFQVAGLVWS